MEISLQGIWLVGWGILVGLTLVSLIVVSAQYRTEPCNSVTPILLSRAFTTDPWRGIVIAANFFAAIVSYYINVSLITLAFILFASAFIISMFDTAMTHDELILLGAFIIMLETFPWWRNIKNPSIWWKIHWCTTAAAAICCISWISLDKICSWWYITEYVFFWQLYLLVYWRIDPIAFFTDKFRTTRVLNGT